MSRVARRDRIDRRLGIARLVAAAGARAQAMHGLPREGRGRTSRPNTRVGRPAVGKEEYKRYCVGCHGDRGDGRARTRQWIDPKPRDFTQAVFKCRSTPSGTLPTDQDLINTIRRGIVNSNMPQWRPLPDQMQRGHARRTSRRSRRDGRRRSRARRRDSARDAGDDREHSRGPGRCSRSSNAGSATAPRDAATGRRRATLTDSKDQPIRPYNFTTGTRFKCGTTNADLYRIFMTGLDGTPMASFADNIKGERGMGSRALSPHAAAAAYARGDALEDVARHARR